MSFSIILNTVKLFNKIVFQTQSPKMAKKGRQLVYLINLFMISCKQILHLRFYFSLADLVIGFKNNFQIKYS